MPVWEAAQQLLGLTIPFLLCLHMLGTLGLSVRFGMDPSYPFVLWATWSDPLQQIALMAAAWTHGCIGMHFWLRLQPWYRRGLPLFFAAALLLPALALAGFAVGGRDILALARRTPAGSAPCWSKSASPDAPASSGSRASRGG